MPLSRVQIATNWLIQIHVKCQFFVHTHTHILTEWFDNVDAAIRKKKKWDQTNLLNIHANRRERIRTVYTQKNKQMMLIVMRNGRRKWCRVSAPRLYVLLSTAQRSENNKWFSFRFEKISFLFPCIRFMDLFTVLSRCWFF